MTFILDMGAHARFIWPAYAAFLVIFAALVIWVMRSAARSRARLAQAEEERKR